MPCNFNSLRLWICGYRLVGDLCLHRKQVDRSALRVQNTCEMRTDTYIAVDVERRVAYCVRGAMMVKSRSFGTDFGLFDLSSARAKELTANIEALWDTRSERQGGRRIALDCCDSASFLEGVAYVLDRSDYQGDFPSMGGKQHDCENGAFWWYSKTATLKVHRELSKVSIGQFAELVHVNLKGLERDNRSRYGKHWTSNGYFADVVDTYADITSIHIQSGG